MFPQLPRFLLGLPANDTHSDLVTPDPCGPFLLQGMKLCIPGMQAAFQVPIYRLYDKLQAHRILSDVS